MVGKKGVRNAPTVATTRFGNDCPTSVALPNVPVSMVWPL